MACWCPHLVIDHLQSSTLFSSYPCEDDDDLGGDNNGIFDGDDDGDNVTDDDDGDYFFILTFAPIPLIWYHWEEWDDDADYKDPAVILLESRKKYVAKVTSFSLSNPRHQGQSHFSVVKIFTFGNVTLFNSISLLFLKKEKCERNFAEVLNWLMFRFSLEVVIKGSTPWG